MRKKNFYSLLTALLFFAFGLVTLSDYGLIWDAPTHYWKGQSFLRYILTREEDYRTLVSPRRSFYQSDEASFNYYLNKAGVGHPSLSDLLAASTNYIFYQQLGILPDVEAHHLYIILISSLLVLVVFRFACEVYGLFAALVATLSLVLYPLFLAESHFNVKDPVEAAFYGLTIYTFYKGIVKPSWKWILISSLFAGFALGTKFNILFASFTIFFWLLILKWKEIKALKWPFSPKVSLCLALYPLIMVSLLFLTSPRLWFFPSKFFDFFRYYKQIGYGITYQPRQYLTFFDLNTYAFQWILYTTPLVILFFSIIGIIVAVLRWRKEPKAPSLLILFWFLVPILRVSLPKMGIYGGVRQIMEFIPAMAILSAIGAENMVRWLDGYMAKIKTINHLTIWPFSHSARKTRLILLQTLTLLMFVPILIKMIQIHPNQNVYFNPLIGGLKGAKEKNFPDWGNSMGNVFRQGINWINKNAQEGANLTLAVSLEDAAPKIWLREDINYSSKYRSGMERKGEYVMEMTSDMGWPNFCYWVYVQNFLEPIHEVKVDGVGILRIWKNDVEHTKEGFLAKEKLALLTDCVEQEED